MNPVEISDLYFKYQDGNENILNGINLKIESGKVTSILGLSGCGKSTLCYCICGIVPHIYHGEIKGDVLLYGKPVSGMLPGKIATITGIVFQDPDTQLFSPTVEDEIAFGPENLCIDRDEIARRIDICLKLVNMEKHRFDHPENLSGGEKQLIAIASVLSMDPSIIIFDESLSQIDREGKSRIKNVILQLKNNGKAVIMVEHDPENLELADEIYFLKNGKIEKIEDLKGGGFAGFYRV